MHESIAEVVGTLLGDGCLSKYWDSYNSRDRYEIVFTGHVHDYNYYCLIIQPIFIKEFGTKGQLYLRKDGSTRYHIRSKRIFTFFGSIGIPIGKKKRFRIPESC